MPRSAALRAVLFDTRHPEPQNVDAWSVDVASLTDTQLLWIDLQDSARQDPVAERLDIPREIMDTLRDTAPMPRLADAGDRFWLRASGIHPLGENGGFEVHAIDLIS